MAWTMNKPYQPHQEICGPRGWLPEYIRPWPWADQLQSSAPGGLTSAHDGDHVGSQHDIQGNFAFGRAVLIPHKLIFQPIQNLGDVLCAFTRGQFLNVLEIDVPSSGVIAPFQTAATDSSTARRILPNSRSALKYPTAVIQGSAAEACSAYMIWAAAM